jgi:hypothetical protein
VGLDFKFGLGAADLDRTIELTGLDELQRQQLAQRPSDSLYWRAIANPPGARDPQVVNSALWRSAQIPAINGHGTARAMAGLYVALQQGEILSEALLSQSRTAHTVGVDRVFGEPNAWGLGFGVDADGYGMGGLGGSYAGYSLAGDYAIAFATGSMGSHERIDRIDNAFRSLIGLDPIA